MAKTTTRDLARYAQEKRQDGGFVVPWGDTNLEVPAPAFWPKDARKAAQRNEAAESMRLICGPSFDEFVAVTGEDAEVVANLVWEVLVEEMGVPLGKPSPSSES